MNWIEAIILGIVQGLTEFLPVSSSGHLVITQNLFGITNENITFEVFVHFGTLLSVLVVYFNDVVKMITSFFAGILSKNIKENFQNDSYFRLSIFVIIGTLPAVFAGLFLKDFFESIFHSQRLVGVTLIITSVILFSTRFIPIKMNELKTSKSLSIGMAQALAIFPGISRSGMTISAGLFSGLPREEAARFSFLLAIPAILGATVLETGGMLAEGIAMSQLGILFLGMAASFIVGYFAIRVLLKILQTGKFSWFAPYCLIVGIIVLIFVS